MIDHRKLGRELDLFDSDPLIGAGLPFWLPAGAAARYEVESYIREEERLAGYQHVYSPPIGKRSLYELSGHWEHFQEDMFPPMPMSEHDEFLLRPALCPHHALIFQSRPRSYRDLPLRIAELGGMYRAERSGVLGGLTRVRSIWINDAHIFCPLDRVGSEIAGVLAMIGRAHAALGVECAGFRLSLRGHSSPDSRSSPGGRSKYPGDVPMWDRAEALLRGALDDAGLRYVEEAGEAAFYGPKIDVQIVDPMGRESTLSTIQVDFYQPARFDLSYVGRSGGRERPVMVHRSVLGAMERLFAHLIEVHAGAFPIWYAPVQIAIAPISEDQSDVANSFARRCVEAGLRVEIWLDGSLGARVRRAVARGVPYVAVIGTQEAAAGEVALRSRDGYQLAARPEAEAIAMVVAIAAERNVPRLDEVNVWRVL